MRSSTNSTTTPIDAGFRYGKSPVPFLFASLALMLGLIGIALLMLACSYIKSSSNSPREAEERSIKQVEEVQVDVEPKIVVIMAGDHNPTYLANPVSCNCQSSQEV